MKSFFRSGSEQMWRVEKWTHVGPYLNSPRLWVGCGVIRATDRAAAALKAMFMVGSSQVRVTPLRPSEMKGRAQ